MRKLNRSKLVDEFVCILKGLIIMSIGHWYTALLNFDNYRLTFWKKEYTRLIEVGWFEKLRDTTELWMNKLLLTCGTKGRKARGILWGARSKSLLWHPLLDDNFGFERTKMRINSKQRRRPTAYYVLHVNSPTCTFNFRSIYSALINRSRTIR